MGRTKAMAVALAVTAVLAAIGGGWHWIPSHKLRAHAVQVSADTAQMTANDGWAW